jgi:hypothetical protein
VTYTELQQGIADNPPVPSRNALWEALQKGDLTKYTPKQIEKGMLQEFQGKNLYTLAAEKGHLDKVPKDLLTQKNLATPDTYQLTTLHWAAVGGHLHQIPKERLTAENLLQPNASNLTCLHLGARSGNLHKLPPLPFATLIALQTHFKKDPSEYKKEILAFVQKQIQKNELHKSVQSCDHPAL